MRFTCSVQWDQTLQVAGFSPPPSKTTVPKNIFGLLMSQVCIGGRNQGEAGANQSQRDVRFTSLVVTTCRVSTWSGGKEAAPRGAEARGGNNRSAPMDGALGEVSGGKTRAGAVDGASTRGENGTGDDDDERDEREREADNERRKMRDSMASDAQRLTSEFAAGRLTAPHFFGAMLVSGGI